MRYGEVHAATGVAGADLLAEYEAYKAAAGDKDSGDEDSGDEDKEDGWVDVDSGDEEDEIAMNDEEEGAGSDGEVPNLMLLGEDEDEDAKPKADDEAGEKQLDLSKLSDKERSELKQKLSSERIFTAAEFAKMKKLVDRQQQAKRDPRLAARLKRAKARGEEFDDISDDSDSDSDDEDIHVKGMVNGTDIMADSERKRMSKAEKLENIIEGRQKWEANERAGGSTNTEKKRKKNFSMSKFSFSTRSKMWEKTTAKHGRKQKSMVKEGMAGKKKRRRKH